MPRNRKPPQRNQNPLNVVVDFQKEKKRREQLRRRELEESVEDIELEELDDEVLLELATLVLLESLEPSNDNNPPMGTFIPDDYDPFDYIGDWE